MQSLSADGHPCFCFCQLRKPASGQARMTAGGRWEVLQPRSSTQQKVKLAGAFVSMNSRHSRKQGSSHLPLLGEGVVMSTRGGEVTLGGLTTGQVMAISRGPSADLRYSQQGHSLHSISVQARRNGPHGALMLTAALSKRLPPHLPQPYAELQSAHTWSAS